MEHPDVCGWRPSFSSPDSHTKLLARCRLFSFKIIDVNLFRLSLTAGISASNRIAFVTCLMNNPVSSSPTGSMSCEERTAFLPAIKKGSFYIRSQIRV